MIKEELKVLDIFERINIAHFSTFSTYLPFVYIWLSKQESTVQIAYTLVKNFSAIVEWRKVRGKKDSSETENEGR